MGDLSRIEHALEADRAALRASLTGVGQKLTASHLVDAATSVAAENGPELAARAGRVARHNKGPLALAGAGLGWMVLKSLLSGSAHQPHATPAGYDRRQAPTATGFNNEPHLTAEFDTRLAAADSAAPGRFGTETYEGGSDMSYDSSYNASNGATLKDRAYATAEDQRARVEQGLDNLPEDAKARVRAAREAAIKAQEEVQYRAKAAAASARQTAHENPLLIGALAFAAGAAIAAALPRTQIENRTIGGHRDRLFDEADRVLREETTKLKAQAETAVAKGQEKAKDAVADAADKAMEAVEAMKPDGSVPAKSNAAKAS
ncbi:hypothetical protein [Tropicimonas sp. S265A]|uniref:hypothetical protein n=1 Tax=Tropicimonas sp. S265A TaxID=3415134 RepID=UPI003C7EA094